MAYIVAVLFLYIAGFRDVSSANGSLPDYASLCPYNTLCNSTRTKTINESHLIPCCQKCSCASDCYMVGNCCPDVKPNNVTEPVYPCVSVSLIFNQDRGLRFRAYDDLQFHVIDTCPDSHAEEAFPACKSPVELKDFVMVSDISEEKVYKNRQCAVCNGIHDYVVWESYTSCEGIVSKSFETLGEKNKYLLKECPFISLPPNERILEKTRCLTEILVIDKCLANNVSNDLKEACETFRPVQNTAFFIETVFKGNTRKMTYKNVYCYLCNNPGQKSVIDVCTLATTSADRFFNRLPFSALLNLNADETHVETTLCRSMDIWDPLDNVCRPLLCQSGHIPLNGACLGSVVYSTGYALSIAFEVITENQIQVGSSLISFLNENLYRFGGRNLHCRTCDLSLYESNNISKYLFEWPLSTSQKCSRDHILSFVERLDRKGEIQLQYEEQEIPVTISLKVYFDNPKGKQRVALLSIKYCPNKVHIDETVLQNCPHIELSREEARSLEVSHEGHENRFKWSLIKNKHTNKTSICVDNYFRLRGLVRNGQNNFHVHINILIVPYVSLLLRATI